MPRRSVSHGQVTSEPATLLGHSSPGTTSWQDLRYVRSHLDFMFLLEAVHPPLDFPPLDLALQATWHHIELSGIAATAAGDSQKCRERALGDG